MAQITSDCRFNVAGWALFETLDFDDPASLQVGQHCIVLSFICFALP